MNSNARLFLTTCLLAATVSCSSDESSDPARVVDPETPFPRALPPVSSMSVDVSEIEGASPASSGFCHGSSVLLVSLTNLNVAAHLSIPVLVFEACLRERPVYLGNQSWRWTTGGDLGRRAWTAELTGVVHAGATVAWMMRVSGTEHELDRFLWYEGQSSELSGNWLFHDPELPKEQNEILESTWTLTNAGSEDEFVLIFESLGPEGRNDRLTYAITEKDVSVDYYDHSRGASVVVEWDEESGEGSLTGFEGEQCCWGERPLHPDIACDPAGTR